MTASAPRGAPACFSVEEFLTGSHQPPEGEVVTATILFTDIVASTEMSARWGHRKWGTVPDDHDTMVRASLQRHRGREIKTLGDGFLAYSSPRQSEAW